MTGMPAALEKSRTDFALATTRFASSGFAGIVATSMSRWPRCMSMVTMAVSAGFSSSCLYRPEMRLERSTIWTGFICAPLLLPPRCQGGRQCGTYSMYGGARLFKRMRLAEGLDLHALLVDARTRRHAGGVALEVADRPDHLPREADVRHRRRVAVAELAGFLLAFEVRLDG